MCQTAGMLMIGAGRAVMLVAAISAVLASPLYSREESRAPAGSSLNCTTFWRVLSLYGLADPRSIAEANRMLDAVLPRGQEEATDPEDKFTSWKWVHGKSTPRSPSSGGTSKQAP